MELFDRIVVDKKILCQKSRNTNWAEVNALSLPDRLKASNDNMPWTKGCGLAAIQIGIPLNFAWYRWGEGEYCLINPRIMSYKGRNKSKIEACLSIPHKEFRVMRHYKINYITDGQVRAAKGVRAQIIQHEIDHLNGILIGD